MSFKIWSRVLKRVQHFRLSGKLVTRSGHPWVIPDTSTWPGWTPNICYVRNTSTYLGLGISNILDICVFFLHSGTCYTGSGQGGPLRAASKPAEASGYGCEWLLSVSAAAYLSPALRRNGNKINAGSKLTLNRPLSAGLAKCKITVVLWPPLPDVSRQWTVWSKQFSRLA